MPPLISRRREGRAGVLTNGKSWNFTYMIDQEEEGDMELEKEKTGEVEVEHGNRKERRIELYQLEEIIADSEENMRRIICTDCPWHC